MRDMSIRWTTLSLSAALLTGCATPGWRPAPPAPGKGCFEVLPKVVRAGREGTVAMRPLRPSCRLKAGDYEAAFYAMDDGPRFEAVGSSAPAGVRYRVAAKDGGLDLRHTFDGEQEHTLVVASTGAGKAVEVLRAGLYSLEDDLFLRRPLKADFHMHSDKSDGTDPPERVPAESRRVGLDAMALTDHRLYAPSRQAREAYAGLPVDLAIYPGEEVHAPDFSVHIVNFGGAFSVNDLVKKDEAAYRSEVRAIEEGLAGFPPGPDRFRYASSVWAFRKIAEGGGLGLFCHPSWTRRNRLNTSSDVTDRLLKERPFGALELIGGYGLDEAESNMLQAARYQEERSAGARIPIVGASDAHGSAPGETLGWYYTVVFSSGTGLQNLVRDIRDLYSVAVEAPPGQPPRAHGPYRLAKYAQFLLREVFPEHDALCEKEGRLMAKAVRGSAKARAELSRRQGETDALYRRLWQP